MRLRTLAAGLALTAALTGCGDDGDSKDKGASDADTSADTPCADFEGKELSADFEGCTEDDEMHAAIEYDCEDGRTLTASASLYGYIGEPAIYDPEGVDGPGYAKLWDACKGFAE